MATKKPTTKKVAAKPVAKKAVAKPVAKKAATPVAKPLVKKAAAKPAAKPVVKKANKPVAKPIAKKAVAKPVAKAPVKPVAKPAAKKATPAQKVSKPVAKAPVKPVAKAPAKPAPKPVVKKAAPVKVAKKPEVKKEAPKKPQPKVEAKVSKPVVEKKVAPAKEKEVVVKAAPEPKAAKPAKSGKKSSTKTIITSIGANMPKKLDVFKTNTFGTSNLKNESGKVIAHRKTSELKRNTDVGTIKKYEPEHTRSILDMSPNKDTTSYRYSDDDLQEFRELIMKKLETAKTELQYLQGVIMRKDEGGTEDTENKYQSIEDGSASMDREQFNQLASRQITFISHLEQALVRIENKTYGICRETGKLIDKARLRAVPHATLSIEAKNAKKN
ncbi:MAG TPA: TraR/DksA C4-type zinc finger protein [Chitinophagaceae bacterium]|nr:TraR/DksA C4-type zinc finger protein [Chitinophagaceae bacterium]